MVADSFDQMKTSAEDVPLVAVGAGRFPDPRDGSGASDVLRVENAGVANALVQRWRRFQARSIRCFPD